MANDDGELESVRRFSAHAAEYTRHRPDYPAALLDFLEEEGWIGIGTEVADIGAGTGIFTERLIGKGCEVWAVEPNGAMLSLAQTHLQTRSQFHGVPAEAEDTRLDDASVDLVIAAQAFHWFDIAATRSEFDRILRPPKRVALVWNIRNPQASPFMEAFEAVISNFGIDYEQVYDRFDNSVERLDDFLGGPVDNRTFEHTQTVDEQGLIGLVTSYSYMPRPNDEAFDDMIDALRDRFSEYASGGTVEICYNTELYRGELS